MPAPGDFSSLSSTSFLHSLQKSLWALEGSSEMKVKMLWKLSSPPFCFNLSSSRLTILDAFSDPSSMPLCASELQAL